MGKIFTERSYISQPRATQLLEDFGFNFFSKPRCNMKNKHQLVYDKLLSPGLKVGILFLQAT
ncbi:hypothetical protein ACX27_09855 [Nostoc piscinale CENA21]|uniref:Transposase n=1 Tax=Nostoc piscinale CENA21 TaxID=224013 RepID=A0A0M4TU85_9NOSO|nr:hypothetical protein [Nostoc piscinale]ALF53081.1 hypothetical protein ACX27_09855 [Nostoc piscinale CENA21]